MDCENRLRSYKNEKGKFTEQLERKFDTEFFEAIEFFKQFRIQILYPFSPLLP